MVRINWSWVAFVGNGRADAVEKHLITHSKNLASPREWLYLCGPPEAATQVALAGGDACVETEVTEKYRGEYSHRFEWADGVPTDIVSLVELLEEILSLRSQAGLDCAVVFDWYKKIPDEDDPNPRWENTAAGELIYRGKYWSPSPARARARRDLVAGMKEVIDRHPLYRDASTIITVPGHEADYNSFGEMLARAVGDETGKRVVHTRSLDGPRPEQKQDPTEDLLGAFEMPESLSGENVIVLDDVIRSGGTMRAVAAAARLAGAAHVYGLAAVKTRRS